jgi:solute carrier family 25 S-adenosylmethionine transporter 26
MSPSPSSWQTDALAGGTAGIATDLIFYALDSAKVKMQAGKSITQGGVGHLFRGALPTALTGSAPSFAAFFAAYTLCKTELDSKSFSSFQSIGLSNESISVLVASTIGGIPSSLAGNPSDVVKKQMFAGAHHGTPSWMSTASSIYRLHGLGGFMHGARANLAKDVPFAAIKMSLYEGCARAYLSFTRPQQRHLGSSVLNKTETAFMGLASGALTAFITCPLDCANTKIKSGDFGSRGVLGTMMAVRLIVSFVFVDRSIVILMFMRVRWFKRMAFHLCFVVYCLALSSSDSDRRCSGVCLPIHDNCFDSTCTHSPSPSNHNHIDFCVTFTLLYIIKFGYTESLS